MFGRMDSETWIGGTRFVFAHVKSRCQLCRHVRRFVFESGSVTDTITCCKLLVASACWDEQILLMCSVNVFGPGNHRTPTLAVFLGTAFVCWSVDWPSELGRGSGLGLFTVTVATFLQANTCSACARTRTRDAVFHIWFPLCKVALCCSTIKRWDNIQR